MIETWSAVTFMTGGLARVVRIDHALGFEKIYRGKTADSTSDRAGQGF